MSKNTSVSLGQYFDEFIQSPVSQPEDIKMPVK